MRGRIPAIVFIVLVSSPVPAAADWFAAPYFGVRFAASTTGLLGFTGTQRDKALFGSTVGFLSDGILGVEADVGFVPGFYDAGRQGVIRDSLVTTVMGNVMVAVPRTWSRYGLRPFVSSGVGLLRARGQDVAGAFEIESDLLGLNVGGGVLGPLSDRTSLRMELRYFRNLGTDEESPNVGGGGATEVYFWRATVGLSFTF